MQDTNWLAKTFLKRQITGVYRVVATVDGEDLVVPDTVVFAMDDGLVQVVIEEHWQRSRRMASPADLEFIGDWDDRSSCRLQVCDAVQLPVHVAGVHSVWENIKDGGADHLVGAFLSDAERGLVLGLKLHLDDVDVGPPEGFFQYLGATLYGVERVVIRRER